MGSLQIQSDVLSGLSSRVTTEDRYREIIVEAMSHLNESFVEQARVEEMVLGVRRFQEATLSNLHEIPLLPVLSAPPSTGLVGSLKRATHHVNRVHWLCPVCGEKRGDGFSEKGLGKGYELKQMKYLFKALLTAFKFSLIALQLAVNIGGLPINASPIIDACASALGDVVSPDELKKAIHTEMQQLVLDGLSETRSSVGGMLNADESATPVPSHASSSALTAAAATAAAAGAVSTPPLPCPPAVYLRSRPRISINDVMLLKTLLSELNETIPPNSSRLGLVMTTSDIGSGGDGSIAWVCAMDDASAGQQLSPCQKRFKALGKKSLIVDISIG